MIDTFVFVKLLYKWGQSTYIAVMRNLTPFLNPAFNVASHLDKVVLKSLSVHSFDAVIRLKPCCFLPAHRHSHLSPIPHLTIKPQVNLPSLLSQVILDQLEILILASPEICIM